MEAEYRTKELMQDQITVIKILIDKGMTRVRHAFHTSATVQFKPMAIIAYENPRKEDKYIMFTSRYADDSRGKRIGIYSSIRMLDFDGKTKKAVTDKVTIADLEAMDTRQF